MDLLLFVTLLTRSAPALDVNAEAIRCGQRSLARLEKQTTLVGKAVLKLVGNRLDMLHTKTEREFLLNHPASANLVRFAGCRAIALSIVGCGVNVDWFLRGMGDEESDAVRHYTYSALLSCARGKAFAEKFTIAHEGDQPWDDGNLMDIHNNYAGFEWAEPAQGNCAKPDVERRLVRAALAQLEVKKLVTIKVGETACRDPRAATAQLDGLSAEAFSERVRDVTLSLKKVLPHQCP